MVWFTLKIVAFTSMKQLDFWTHSRWYYIRQHSTTSTFRHFKIAKSFLTKQSAIHWLIRLIKCSFELIANLLKCFLLPNLKQTTDCNVMVIGMFRFKSCNVCRKIAASDNHPQIILFPASRLLANSKQNYSLQLVRDNMVSYHLQIPFMATFWLLVSWY